MHKKFFAALLGAVLVAPLASHAEGSYFKAGVGASEYKAEGATENKTAVTVAYGFSLDKNFDVELGYAHLGKVKNAGGSVEAQTIYIAGVGNLPLTDAFSAFGKVGVAVNQFNDKPTGSAETTDTKARALLGLGLAYNFTKDVAGTLEYQYFGKVDQIKVSALTVGIKYGF